MGIAPHSSNSWEQLDATVSGKSTDHCPVDRRPPCGTTPPSDDEIFNFLCELRSGDYSAKTKSRLKRGAEAMFDPTKKGISFEEAIGLKNVPNLHSLNSRMRLIQSRAELRPAWQLVRAETSSNWACAEALGAAIKKFAEHFWPKWSQLDTPPRGASKLRRALHSAFKAKNGKVAATPRQLYTVMVILADPDTEA